MWQLSYPRDEWPRYLWRVIHVNTQSVSYSSDPRELLIHASAALDVSHMIPNGRYFGLDEFGILLEREANRHPVASDLFAFLNMMTNHINWYSESRTWFLSTFSDGNHAVNWAEQRHRWAENRCKNDDITVCKIDTTLLPPSARLFNMDALNVLFRLKEQVKYTNKDEVLVFGRIPEEAVVDVFELWKNGYGSGQGASSFFANNVPGDKPGTVLHEDLDGRQLVIRAKVLATEDSYPEEWAALSDGHWGRTFEVPGTIALCCGYSEQSGEGQSEEEEEEVEVEVVEEVEEEEVEEEVEVVEEEVEEEEVVVVVVAEQEEEKEEEEKEEEEKEEEEDKDGEAVVEQRVKEEVKGKDGDQDGEPERKEEEDENEREGEDEMAQLIGRLAIST